MKEIVFKKLSLLMLSLLVLGCSQQDNTNTHPKADGYVQGTHYQPVKQQLKGQDSENSVTEFFWYGCPHCQSFEPYLHQWEQTLPKGYTVKRLPAIWNDVMVLHAKLFFIAKETEHFEALHGRLFKEVIALRGQNNRELQRQHFAKVFAEYGVEEQAFFQQLSSPELEAQLQQAEALAKASGLRGTPSLVVNNQYLVLNQSVSSAKEILDIARFLMDQKQ